MKLAKTQNHSAAFRPMNECADSRQTTLIAVAICTYNNAALLKKALISIEQQVVDGSFSWSVLVVQNNCTDDTSEVIESFRERRMIPYLRTTNEPRQGVAFVRERAVHEANAEYIAFVDDDVVLEPDWLQRGAEFCRLHPNAGAIGARIRLWWEMEPSPLALACAKGFAELDYGDQVLRLPEIGRAHLVTAGLIVSKRAVLESGWLEHRHLRGRTPTSMVAGEDAELVLRIRKAGYELWYNPAMRQQHFVPARRTSFRYLCRLYRGFAETDTILRVLADGRQPSFGWRLGELSKSVGHVVRRSGAFLFHDLIRKGRSQTHRAIQVHEAWGQMLSAWRFFWRGLN